MLDEFEETSLYRGEDRFVSIVRVDHHRGYAREMNSDVILGGRGGRFAFLEERVISVIVLVFDDVVIPSPLAIVVDYVTLMTRWS